MIRSADRISPEELMMTPDQRELVGQKPGPTEPRKPIQ